jgi:argininosuccinate lyase
VSGKNPPRLDSAGQKMWGGRFDRGPDEAFYQFERSWTFDRRLLPYELALDRAWARALARIHVLSDDECRQIIAASDEIGVQAKSDPEWLNQSRAEDVHHFVETELIARLGPVGAKLHTGRSRNEMVATEFRMYVRDAAEVLRMAVCRLARAFLVQAETNFGVPMPGMTHLQRAQPVLLSHWLLAHGEAFFRDAQRIDSIAVSVDSCPLGAGALAGCAFPIDREVAARELGFSRTTPNSIDAVGDRDFALEYLFALSVLATHLSRLAEAFTLFATPEFAFVMLPDEFSTGSSLMPQKKNPDAWELIRGKTGRITGALVSLLTTMKGLPSSYDRDLQEDKEPLFAAHDQALAMLEIAAATVAATTFNERRLREAASDPALVATEAADYLVTRGVPFREAHEIIGRAIRQAENQKTNLRDLPLDELRKLSPAFGADFLDALTVDAALSRRAGTGGTAPDAVRRAMASLQDRIAAVESRGKTSTDLNAPASAARTGVAR